MKKYFLALILVLNEPLLAERNYFFYSNMLLSNQNNVKAFERKEVYLTSLIVFSLLLLISFLLYRGMLFKRKALHDKKMLLQKEMFARTIIETEELERSRIVKELHDGIGQQISAAKLNISAAQSILKSQNKSDKLMLQNAADLLDESVKKVRSVSRSMIPNSLINIGFIPALEEYVDRINGSGNIKIILEVTGQIKRQDQIREIILFRVLKEVIKNSIKHSHAKEIFVQLVKHQNELNILVEDNGKGFDFDKVLKEGIGTGLKNIESRVSFLNGKIFYDSRIGKGTIVNLEIPF